MKTSPRTTPERPSRLCGRFDLSGSRLTILYRRIDPTGCFLLVWLIGWTVGCVFLAGMVIQQPAVSSLLFALPFWAAWGFVFCLVINSFFRRETFELGPEGVRFVCRVIVTLQRREVPLSEVEGFGAYSKVTDSESNTVVSGIEVRTRGQGFRFGQGLPHAERRWLIDQLEEHLSRLAPQRARPVADVEPHAETVPLGDLDREYKDDKSQQAERLTAAVAPVPPPSDSRWMRLEDFHEISLATRGRLDLGTVGVLLFFNAFWNGIVSVFLMQLFVAEDGPDGIEWWGLFVFLIPFEVIGLLMFAALLATLLEPFRRTRWSFTYGGAEQQTTWLGIGPRRAYPVDWLDRIELRTGSRGRFGIRRSEDTSETLPAVHRLVFIDRQNDERFTIDGLTEGEARWMADAILRECQRWFRG